MGNYNTLQQIGGEWVLHDQSGGAMVCWRTPQVQVRDQKGIAVMVFNVCSAICPAFKHSPIDVEDEKPVCTVCLKCFTPNEVVYDCDVIVPNESEPVPEGKGTLASLNEFMSSKEKP